MFTTFQTLFSRPVVAVACLLVLVAGLAGAGQVWAMQPVLPPGYAPVAEVDLAAGAQDDALLAQFSLAHVAEVGIFFTVRNLDTPYFDLSVQGPDGVRIGILHGENYRTDWAGSGEWRKLLPPGNYRLLLTAAQSTGRVTTYLNRPSTRTLQ
jgi:hypothetical protein